MNSSPRDMRRDFTNRDDLIAYLKREFPQAAAVSDRVSPVRGGRRAATAILQTIHPEKYAATRNYLDGAVTRLSPYLRHGVVTPVEVRAAAFQRAGERGAGKLVNELAWRDYWQRLYRKLGQGIWIDQEAYKTGFSAAQYSDHLPDDVANSSTGRVCIDQISRELVTTGYLHNHARLWIAAYLIHWRRVKWQVGARWFLQHLLDGDPASNNLSWQWVASTFSQKPYFPNRENIERFSKGVYCRECPLYGCCDFEGSYPQLAGMLFPNKPDTWKVE